MEDFDNFSYFQWGQAITFVVFYSVVIIGLIDANFLRTTILWLIIPALTINIALTAYAIYKFGAKKAFSYLEFFKKFMGHAGGRGPK